MSLSLSVGGLIMALGLAQPAVAQTRSLGGITVGEPLASAASAMRVYGQVTPVALAGGGYLAGDYVAVGCAGRVWGVTRQASSSFASFTRMGAVAEAQYGPPTTTIIQNQEGEQHFGVITVEWRGRDGLTYALMFGTTGGRTSASENLHSTKLCPRVTR